MGKFVRTSLNNLTGESAHTTAVVLIPFGNKLRKTTQNNGYLSKSSMLEKNNDYMYGVFHTYRVEIYVLSLLKIYLMSPL